MKPGVVRLVPRRKHWRQAVPRGAYSAAAASLPSAAAIPCPTPLRGSAGHPAALAGPATASAGRSTWPAQAALRKTGLGRAHTLPTEILSGTTA